MNKYPLWGVRTSRLGGVGTYTGFTEPTLSLSPSIVEAPYCWVSDKELDMVARRFAGNPCLRRPFRVLIELGFGQKNRLRLELGFEIENPRFGEKWGSSASEKPFASIFENWFWNRDTNDFWVNEVSVRWGERENHRL